MDGIRNGTLVGDRRGEEYMLTTLDNPFDPFTQWDEWYAWDNRAGYCTPGLLARIARSSDDLSELDQHLVLQIAIDEIVRENISGMHRKLKKGEFQTLVAEREKAAQPQG